MDERGNPQLKQQVAADVDVSSRPDVDGGWFTTGKPSRSPPYFRVRNRIYGANHVTTIHNSHRAGREFALPTAPNLPR